MIIFAPDGESRYTLVGKPVDDMACKAEPELRDQVGEAQNY